MLSVIRPFLPPLFAKPLRRRGIHRMPSPVKHARQRERGIHGQQRKIPAQNARQPLRMRLRITQKEHRGQAGQQRRRIDFHEVHGFLRIGAVRFEKTIRIPPALFAAEQYLPVGGGLFEILLIRHPRQLQRFPKKPESARKFTGTRRMENRMQIPCSFMAAPPPSVLYCYYK